MEKSEIRKKILEQRESIDSDIRSKWDESIFKRLITSELYKRANTIFTFVSFKSEVDTHMIINDAISNHKTICVPKINSKQEGIKLYKIDSFNQLKKGYFGILEPIESCQQVDKNSLDLILMPGVAFDRYGGRVGYGAAFYDRFISNMNKHVDKIALAYHFQVLDSVPMNEHDIRIDGIITEKENISTAFK
ncbi:5-formyltetrahydrofolate cyclo-ligase [Clostridium sp. YIM B02515]|uniref:5-formyltetrahydrofolate cyclo-ligase n=1 Tax=Clostridium rhizosphaerae TaxID=2803861 RepID=A0ABS1TCP4_9CLOT|nr:5-formyltetrahydrofolate cyclo-ligase [Clostridium rhizosphaerae]